MGGVSSCGAADTEDDPCDYVVTLQVTVMLAADGSPVEGATVHVGTDPPDNTNTITTDGAGIARWEDTSFITGFSAQCGDELVGTVQPYDPETFFTHEILVSASGLAEASTQFTVTRESRNIVIILEMDVP